MPTSPIIDLAIGLTFVFGVTAALASLVTELIARLIGLRGAYLLSGLRELVDGGGSGTDLVDTATDYKTMRELMQARTAPAEQPQPAQPSPEQAQPAQPSQEQAQPAQPSQAEPSSADPSHAQQPSATGALLGGPILGNQGIAGQFPNRKLTLGPTTGKGRLPKMTADRTPDLESGQKPGRLWSQLRSLPSYISARSFGEAVIDMVVPDATGQTTMDTIQQNVNALPDSMSALKPSLQALVKDASGDISRFRTSL